MRLQPLAALARWKEAILGRLSFPVAFAVVWAWMELWVWKTFAAWIPGRNEGVVLYVVFLVPVVLAVAGLLLWKSGVAWFADAAASFASLLLLLTVIVRIPRVFPLVAIWSAIAAVTIAVVLQFLRPRGSQYSRTRTQSGLIATLLGLVLLHSLGYDWFRDEFAWVRALKADAGVVALTVAATIWLWHNGEPAKGFAAVGAVCVAVFMHAVMAAGSPTHGRSASATLYLEQATAMGRALFEGMPCLLVVAIAAVTRVIGAYRWKQAVLLTIPCLLLLSGLIALFLRAAGFLSLQRDVVPNYWFYHR